MKNLLFAIVVSLGLVSCGLKTDEHYFKLEDFTEGKVYKFVCEEDTVFNQYWEMKSDLDEKTLTTVTYEYKMLKTSSMVERYTDDGAELISFVLYDGYDGEVIEDDCEIIEKDVMLWSVKDKPFSYRVKPSGEIGFEGEMMRARTYINRAHMDVMGEKYEVLGFRDVMSYSDYPEVFPSMKFYAEGLGLVAIEFEEHGKQYVLQLQEIYSMDEWEAMKPKI